MEGELESRVEVFNVTYEIDVACRERHIRPRVEDIEAMEDGLNKLAKEGWALRTIYDSPAKEAGGCCSNTYGSAYACCMYRPKGTTEPRRIILQQVECPGVEFYVTVGSGKNRHIVLDRREMDMSNVEAAIQQGYYSGQRLATAIDVEGEHCYAATSHERPIRRKFFLFFEHFEDLTKNVPHCAFITMASRLRFGSHGCCQGVNLNYEYDTKILRDTWGMARSAGWHVAEIFDTGREKANDRGHGYHRTLGPRYSNSASMGLTVRTAGSRTR